MKSIWLTASIAGRWITTFGGVLGAMLLCSGWIWAMPSPQSEGGELLQMTSAGHVLGFGESVVYVASRDHALRVEFSGARIVRLVADGAAADQSSDGRAIPFSGRVTYPGVWEGVDVVYQATPAGIFESVYHVHNPHDTPGADGIRLRYNRPVRLDGQGNLVTAFPNGNMVESAPVAWQMVEGHKRPVQAAFVLHGEREVGFDLSGCRPGIPVTIDPVLIWNTFLGGAGDDSGQAIAVDASRNVYVGGTSDATWGDPERTFQGLSDAFAAKLSSAGALTWNTFLGGAGSNDEGQAIAVDGDGNVYVGGSSTSTWGSPKQAYAGGSFDAFAVKLSSAGALTWNTFLGGAGSDHGQAIAVDGAGNVYVGGDSSATWGSSPVRPYAGGSFDAFAAQLTSAGALTWNTFLGGTDIDYGMAIAVDSGGNVYVGGYSYATWGEDPVRSFAGGRDAFAAKLTSLGALTWNTFLGSAGADYGQAIAVDDDGNVYVGGYSNATWGSPVQPYTGSYDAFAAKLTSAGALTWNTFLGSLNIDYGYAIAVDDSGNVCVGGQSSATWGSPVRTYTGNSDAFAAKLTSAGALTWNTFLGGDGTDYGYAIAVDASRNVYVGGTSDATWGTPVQAYTSLDDAFAVRLPETPAEGSFYRSKATGNWSLAATWEESDDGSVWRDADTAPDDETSCETTIRNLHTVTVDANLTTDQTTVESGGTLTVSNGVTLTIANGFENDLAVTGTLVNNGSVSCVSGSTVVFNGGDQTIPALTYSTLSFAGSTSGATKTFADGTTIVGAEISLTETLTLTGSSEDNVTVQVTTPGTSAWRVFNVNGSGKTITLSNMTIKGGDVSNETDCNGGSIIHTAGALTLENVIVDGSRADYGGGLLYANDDGCTITNCTFANCKATVQGAGIRLGGGSGGSFTVSGSTFDANWCTGTYGGGLSATSGATNITITNSTFFGNKCNGYGGAIQTGCEVTLTNVTIAENHSDYNDTGGETGGGFYLYADTAYLQNVILANNYCGSATSTADDYYFRSGATLTDNGYNIVKNSSVAANATGGFNHANTILYNTKYGQAGTSFASWTKGGVDLPNQNLSLASSLADNGGPTQTLALCKSGDTEGGCSGASADSLAIDQIPSDSGQCGSCDPYNIDQRGITRPYNGSCDIGAYERTGTTLVELASFTADGFEDHVLVRWETSSELDHAGFHLWRAKGAEGDYARITDTLIPARGGPAWGAEYLHEDWDVETGKSYFYQLEDIDTAGVKTFHGPVSAWPGVANIQAGNVDQAATATQKEPVSVKMAVQAGDHAGTAVEYWVAAHTPFGWYTYGAQGWKPGIAPAAVGLLADVAPLEVVHFLLTPGWYTFYLAVDDQINGQPDLTWMDSIEVEVE